MYTVLEDTTADVNERIGRALRQTDNSDSFDHQEKNAQNRQNTENPQINANAYGQTDRGNKTSDAFNVVLFNQIFLDQLSSKVTLLTKIIVLRSIVSVTFLHEFLFIHLHKKKSCKCR